MKEIIGGAMTSTPTRIEKVGLEKIYIFDDLFSKKQIERFGAVVSNAAFTFLHASRADTVKYREWCASFSVSDFMSHPLHKASIKVAKHFSGNKKLKCYDVFSSASTFGDMSFIHSDSTNSGDISILYYANSKWDPEWGGETIFYTERKDAALVVSVKPGRLIVFNGNVLHRAGTPTKLCPEVRITLSMRFEK
ncbi:2OG-Fe(II) oxygenase [Enterovibrio calviensis]|uniref:2OG-Fe(II) oxygenase n=1 Tax=Enterovibrio calviensis TaxID=91359 RepID=UPI00373544DF